MIWNKNKANEAREKRKENEVVGRLEENREEVRENIDREDKGREGI